MSALPTSKTAGRRIGIALVALALVAAFVVAATWLLPAWLASRLEDELGSALGRRVTIGALDLSWLRGAATIADVTIAGPLAAEADPDERAVFQLARLSLDLSFGALFDREIHLGELQLGSPVLHLSRDAQGELAPLVLAEDDGGAEEDPDASAGWSVRLDELVVEDLRLVLEQEGGPQREVLVLRIADLSLADLSFVDGVADVGALTLDDPSLVVHPALRGPEPVDDAEEPPGDDGEPQATGDAPASEAAPDTDDPLGQHRLASLEIRDATFALRRDGAEDLELGLRLTAQDLSLAQGARFPLQWELSLADGKLSAEGEIGVRPLVYDGSLSWSEVPLSRLLPVDAEADASRVAVERATAHGDAKLLVRTEAEGDAPPRIELSGSARVTGAEGTLPEGRFAWEELDAQVTLLRIPLVPGAPPQVELSKLTLRAPEIDLARVPPEEPDEPPDPGAEGREAEEDAAPRVRIASLEVENGTLNFRDEAPPHDFETRWRDVTIAAGGVRWPERDVERFDLDAAGPSGAKLRVDASLKGGRGTIETEVERLGLPPLNPYAARYTGVTIDRGQGSLKGTVTIGADRTSADSRVFLHELRVTEQEPGWFQRFFGLPLDVALALLRDIQGDITVPVRVEIEQDRNQVDLGRLLASTLRQAILGAVTTPLKLLGGLAKVAGAALGPALEPLPCAPGAVALRDPDPERLRSLVSMLASKPQLAVALHGRAGPEDATGIRLRSLVERARSDEPLPGVDGEVREALAALDPDAGPDLPPALAARIQPLLDAIPVGEAEILDLARERALHVKQTLVQDYGIEEDDVDLEQSLVGEPGVLIELRASPVSPSASG